MSKRLVFFILCVIFTAMLKCDNAYAQNDNASLLTDPILMNPQDSSVYVVWFTEFEGANNQVLLYENGCESAPTRTVCANTTRLSRVRGGRKESNSDDPSICIPIYRHLAYIHSIPENHGDDSERIAYSVVSDNASSDIYTLAAKPQSEVGVRLLLTSDLQTKNMCAANFEAAYETLGDVDGILINGDLVDVADRAYDWFYSDNAFFKVLQGRANHKIGSRVYKGAPILQNTPIYTAIGNHDVMGVYSDSNPLSYQFNNPSTIEWANKLYEAMYPDGLSERERARFIMDNSYNTITVNEIFSLPAGGGGENYYAVSFGNMRLLTLNLSRVWRLPKVGVQGKYSELPGAVEALYGYGDFIFEPVCPGSAQHDFLRNETERREYEDAEYRVVMAHYPHHSLGCNSVPAFTNPVAGMVKDPVTGADMVIYNYPKEQDQIENYVMPLLKKSNTDFLFNAHSHVWCRFVTDDGMNVMETSNVGNNYGGYYRGSAARSEIPSVFMDGDERVALREYFPEEDYPKDGDLFGLRPEYPNVKSLPDNMPYLASDTITAFTLLDTKNNRIDSYMFDTEAPKRGAILFDSVPVSR